jgi:hypothetical protein
MKKLGVTRFYEVNQTIYNIIAIVSRAYIYNNLFFSFVTFFWYEYI